MLLGNYKNRVVTYDGDRALNGHISLLGESGSGKSTKAHCIMMELARQGATSIACDMHHVLAENQILEQNRAIFKEMTNEIDVYKDGIPCDLMRPMKYADGTDEKVVDVVGALSDVFGRAFGFGSIQQATLRSAINEVVKSGEYENKGVSAIGGALREMDTKVAKAVMEKMHMILEHNVFIPGNWPIIEGKINIFRLSKFDPATQEIIAEVILLYIWRRAMVIGCAGDRIFLFLDECQNLPSGKNSILGQLLSEGRKFNLNLLLATQQLLQGSPPVVQQRMAQCGLILYFRPDAGQIRKMAKMIDPNSVKEWVPVLRSLKRGEFVAVGALSIDGQPVDHPLKVMPVEKKTEKAMQSSVWKRGSHVQSNVFSGATGLKD